jgi:pimeloyl-ACP methyl ester carboxylesterase
VVADALTALDALGLSRVVVVGHSWGASTALRLAAEAPGRVLAAVALDGGLDVLRSLGDSREQVRERLTPPRLAVPPDELRRRLASGPLAPWWSEAVAAAVLPLFGVGADGLARARLPFEAHMAILDDLLDTDHEALLPAVSCPAWVVACAPAPGADPVGAALAPAKEAALARAGALLAHPRLLTWQGALHDVPLQWPALVAGLVRAAAEEAASGVRERSSGEGQGP